jgi:hypothetical protein
MAVREARPGGPGKNLFWEPDLGCRAAQARADSRPHVSELVDGGV